MKIMNQLTYKHMIQNKKRTLMTILGIIISVAMITAVSTAAVTFVDFMQRMEMQSTGDWHLKFTNISNDNVKKIEEELGVKSSFLKQVEGFAIFEESSNENKPYFYVEAFDSNAWNAMHVTLKEGRLPKNSSEIVVSKHMLGEQTKPYKVGDVIQLSLGERILGEKNLGQDEGFQKERAGIAGERFEVTKPEKSYTIVGIIERPEYEKFYSSGYTCITYLDEALLKENNHVDVSLMLDSVTQSIYNQGNQVANKLGINESQVELNDDVLRYYGVSRYEDTFNLMIQSLQIILISIIMIGSISLIYNSFAISITERSKQFGMLSSVGVTKKQKRNAVLFEAFSLGMISIPLGIFAGLIGMWITFSCINPVFMNAFSVKVALQMKISYSSIFIAILFSVVTILISAYIPARRASRISAIDAIRQTNDIKLNDKQLRISRITRYLFGIEGILAIKNLKRNRKRYRALVFSMFIGLVLFNSVGSYVYYLSGAVGITLEGDNFDLEVGDLRSEKSIEMLANIRELESVSEAMYIEMPKGYYYWPSDTAKSYLTKEYEDQIMKSVSGIEDISIDEALEYSPITIGYRFLDDDSFREYVSKFGGNAEEYFNTESVRAVLVNKARLQEGYSINEFVPFTLHEGDVVDAMEEYYVEEREEFEKRKFMNTPIIINDVTSEIPDYIGINYTSEPMTLIMPMSMLQQCEEYIEYPLDTSKDILVCSTDPERAEKQIQEILDAHNSKFYLYNRAAETKRSEQLIFVFSVFAYGFITLIALICMANLCNTISTSFALRRREFAMLKSIGMTQKAFMKMIRLESMMYAWKAILYSIPVSLIMTLWIKRSVATNFTAKFGFPLATYGIGIGVVLVVSIVAMFYSTRKIRRENIIEGLKSENI